MLSKIKRLKDIRLTKNAPQKFFSVLVAIILWLLIMDYENPEMTKTFRAVPVTYSSAEQLVVNKLHVETPLDEKVDITVRGRRKDVLSLESSDLKAQVDLSDLSSGTIDLAIALSCKSDKITILNANKTSIRVVLDDIVTVYKAVQHFAEGELPDNYEILDKKIIPSIVAITGPQKTIDIIDKVILPYSLADMTTSATFYDSVVVLDASGQIIEGLNLSNERFKVDITIGQGVELPIVYNYKPFEAENLEIVSKTEATQTVKVKGSVESLKLLKSINSQEIVIPEEAGEYQFSVNLILPEGIVQIEPQQIDVSLKCDFVEQQTYNLTADSIEALNLDAKYIYQLSEPFEKQVILSGYRSVFQAEDFAAPTVTIDFKGLTAGNHKLPYRVVIAEGLTATEPAVLSGEVDVTLSLKDEE